MHKNAFILLKLKQNVPTFPGIRVVETHIAGVNNKSVMWSNLKSNEHIIRIFFAYTYLRSWGRVDRRYQLYNCILGICCCPPNSVVYIYN